MPLDSTFQPASLHSWLGHELEIRGIDAVIYTRYILSILQQDGYQADLLEEFFPSSGCGKTGLVTPDARKGLGATQCLPSGKHGKALKGFKVSPSWKPEKKKPGVVHDGKESEELLKKTAAVECLLSVSDEVMYESSEAI